MILFKGNYVYAPKVFTSTSKRVILVLFQIVATVLKTYALTAILLSFGVNKIKTVYVLKVKYKNTGPAQIQFALHLTAVFVIKICALLANLLLLL